MQIDDGVDSVTWLWRAPVQHLRTLPTVPCTSSIQHRLVGTHGSSSVLL